MKRFPAINWKGALIISTLFLCLQASSYTMDVIFGWDANTESDLAGYKVYYKTESSGPPYEGKSFRMAVVPWL